MLMPREYYTRRLYSLWYIIMIICSLSRCKSEGNEFGTNACFSTMSVLDQSKANYDDSYVSKGRVLKAKRRVCDDDLFSVLAIGYGRDRKIAKISSESDLTNDGISQKSSSRKRSYNKIDGIIFDRDGFDQNGFNTDGVDREGFNRNGFDKYGFNRNKINENGSKFDDGGYDRDGYDRYGFNISGYDRSGFDEYGRSLSDNLAKLFIVE